MATVLVKNLPNVSTTDDDDLLIVNIGGGTEYTTSNIKVADLRTALNSSSNSFASDVEVNGNVTITQEATDGGKTFVGNLVGNVTGSATTVESLSPHTTDKLPEGSANKYFNTANFNAAVQVTQIGSLADVTIAGGGTSTNGKFLLHNGTAFVEADIATYDQSAEITELNNKTGIANVSAGDNLYDLIQATATAAGDVDTEIKTKMGFDNISSGDNLYDLIQATATAAGDADADIKTKMGYDNINAGDNLYDLIQATATAAGDADTVLSGRLDTLEADATTAAAVAAVQADVDQNEADSDAADAALSLRLDTLELDPTTQADVDAAQATANAAIPLATLQAAAAGATNFDEFKDAIAALT